MNEKIAFISDIHLDEKNPKAYGVNPIKNWELILQDVANLGINKVIFGGDIGASTSYKWFIESLQPYQFEIIIGNHDSYSTLSEFYRRGLDHKELYFKKEFMGYKFLFLDSSSKRISAKQLKWLSNELQTKLKIVVFIHHPVLGIDTPIDSKHPLQNREEILKLLQQANRNITIFSGHYHMNAEKKHGKIHQYITQSAAFQVEKNAENIEIDASVYGYKVITFTDETIFTENRFFAKRV